jgi:hypothetical protein
VSDELQLWQLVMLQVTTQVVPLLARAKPMEHLEQVELVLQKLHLVMLQLKRQTLALALMMKPPWQTPQVVGEAQFKQLSTEQLFTTTQLS